MCWSREKDFFFFIKTAFLHTSNWPRIRGPRVGEVINFPIKTSLLLEMLQTKNGANCPCSIQEEVTNVKLLRDDARRQTRTNGNRSPE